MTNNSYRYFIIEATKITIFCVFITAIFKLAGASNNTLLIVFNMAVMSAAATFSPEKKELSHCILGSTVIVASIVLGGLAGFYAPTLSKITSVAYAGLAFLLPQTKIRNTIFVTGAVMFLIFSSLPFNYNDALKYFICGIIVIAFFSILTWVVNLKANHLTDQSTDPKSQGNKINALIAVTALSLAWFISYKLKEVTSIDHLYWIGLTVLVVIQGAQQKNINTAVKRIAINLLGAIIIVILFHYIIPTSFWINFILLTLFLFLIFALGFSYTWRTLFIELFVLGFTRLLGSYQDVAAVDRVILTTIGGLLVITTTLFFYTIFNLYRKYTHTL